MTNAGRVLRGPWRLIQHLPACLPACLLEAADLVLLCRCQLLCDPRFCSQCCSTENAMPVRLKNCTQGISARKYGLGKALKTAWKLQSSMFHIKKQQSMQVIKERCSCCLRNVVTVCNLQVGIAFWLHFWRIYFIWTTKFKIHQQISDHLAVNFFLHFLQRTWWFLQTK